MKITAPPAGRTEGDVTSTFGSTSLTFTDGTATFDGDLPDGVRLYLLGAGYEVDGQSVDAAVEAPPALDSRDVVATLVGTPTRDAAVDPQPGDFLAPVNAGEADPHGPLVVAPGIHAEGERIVAAGPVYTDPAAQEANEKRLAEKLLVDREPVTAPVAPGDFLEQGGPLGLSDPASADAGEAAAKADEPFADAAIAPTGEPRGNASQNAWAEYAKSQGATDEQIAGKSRDDLRAAYGS